MTSTLNTRDQILDCAQGLIQMRGYNGFSFRDIASEVGVKSSSIHYYYPGKTDLAVAVATQYCSAFKDLTDQLIESQKTASAILETYAGVFETTLEQENRLCLCGMLASEINSVEPKLHSVINAFFNEQHEVLSTIISEGQSKGEFLADLDAANFAKAYLATLEGAMMLARVNKKPSDIGLAAKQMIALIKEK